MKKQFSIVYVVLAAIFITCCLVSNIMAVKIVDFFGITLTAAIIIFPITYILGGVLTEIYGYNNARKVIYLGFFCNALFVTFLTIAIYLPYPYFWANQDAFAQVVGVTPRIFIAGLIAFLVGSLLNAMVLSKLKVKTKGRFLWLRLIGSTVIGQGVDTLIFISIVFIGVLTTNQLLWMIWWQFAFKTAYEILFTPLAYYIIKKIKKIEKIDVYDHKIRYHIFKLRDE